MGLVTEIQKVHDFLYKEVGSVKPLLPILLTLLDIFKLKKKEGHPNVVAEVRRELKRVDRRYIEYTLQKIQRMHSSSSLVQRLINDAIDAIRPEKLPDSKLNRIKDRILQADKFLEVLEREEDFIGVLFETLAAHSGVFDKKEGRFFTPKSIILIVVEMVASLYEKNGVDLTRISVCDPCCGSARYLIYWVNRLKRVNSSITEEEIQQIYSNLFGIDINPDVASWATWNMLFHGDGATNIACADSLNYFGIIVYWNFIQRFLEELPGKFYEIREKFKQKSVQGKLRYIESKIDKALTLKDKNEIDLDSEEVKALLDVINTLFDIDRETHGGITKDWQVLDELSRRRDFPSIYEISRLQWGIRDGFDLIITNPPFGRGSQDLMITDPYILCQYKLATELWLGDMTKEITERLLEKQFKKTVAEIYRELLRELGIDKIREEWEIKFKDLPTDLLKKLAIKYGVSAKSRRKNDIVENLVSKLGREIVTEEDLTIDINSLPDSFVKKLASAVLYEKEGGKSRVSEFLYEKIKERIGREWITVEDVYDYEYKLTIKDNATGEEHTIYFNEKWEPILFKDSLPKQVVFLEEFLRLVKEGGFVFTVVDTGVLSNSEDEYVRRFLYRNSRIHAIVEFPHNAFKAAGTGVKTAVILYQKTKNPPEDYDIFGALPQNLGYILNRQDTPPDPDHNDLGKVLCDWRNYLGLGRMCESCKNSDAKEEECCEWYKKEHCPIWRTEIEKADL